MRSVVNTKVKGDAINAFVHDKLLPVIDGQPLDLVAASMLSVIVSSMAPEMEPEALGEAVTTIAQYVITYMSSAMAGETETVN